MEFFLESWKITTQGQICTVQNGGCNVEWQTHGTRRSADHEGSVSMLPSLRIEPVYSALSSCVFVSPNPSQPRLQSLNEKTTKKWEKRTNIRFLFFFQRVVRNTSWRPPCTWEHRFCASTLRTDYFLPLSPGRLVMHAYDVAARRRASAGRAQDAGGGWRRGGGGGGDGA